MPVCHESLTSSPRAGPSSIYKKKMQTRQHASASLAILSALPHSLPTTSIHLCCLLRPPRIYLSSCSTLVMAKLKIIEMFGSQGVGKSSLMMQCCLNIFYPAVRTLSYTYANGRTYNFTYSMTLQRRVVSPQTLTIDRNPCTGEILDAQTQCVALLLRGFNLKSVNCSLR
jgi:hypothetical protein